MSHYHVIGICREHGPQQIAVVQGEAQALEIIHTDLLTKFDEEAVITDVFHTPNVIEFVMTTANETHYMICFSGICSQDFQMCYTMHAITTITRAAEIVNRGGPQAEEIQKVMEERFGVPQEKPQIEAGDDPSLFNSIEAFLNNQQQEGDGPTH
jgi:hypothetical protein